MMHGLTEVNKKKDEINTLVLFPMDISDMYPALDIPECAKIAAEVWCESGMEINLDTEELGLNLAVTVDWADFCHTRIKTRGSHPGITTETAKQSHFSTNQQKYHLKNKARLMFKVALQIMIKVCICMQEHLHLLF